MSSHFSPGVAQGGWVGCTGVYAVWRECAEGEMKTTPAAVPAVLVTQLVPSTPIWSIASASFLLKVLLAASASHCIGIWTKKIPMDVQNASAIRREQEMVTVTASPMWVAIPVIPVKMDILLWKRAITLGVKSGGGTQCGDGLRGCQCDIGGALSSVCSGASGVCQCREHVVGKACQWPEDNYYFPDLYHMKYEIEDGTTPNGRDLRFGFDPLEFPEFSWRGYTQMTSVQLHPDVAIIVFGFFNLSLDTIGAAQSKEITFLLSKEPAFVTVPGNGFADPFSITPGIWVACIKAEGVLLDYLVLLPRDYYEASVLQLPVTEPCAYSGSPQEKSHLPVTRFPCTLACEARHFLLDGEPRPVALRQPTPAHPVMVELSGRQGKLEEFLGGVYQHLQRYLIRDGAGWYTTWSHVQTDETQSSKPAEMTQLTLKGYHTHSLFNLIAEFLELRIRNFYTPGHLPHGVEDRLLQVLALLLFQEFFKLQNQI
ncbi:hypothetical protein P7K49_028269 [Saguinus oedipus]|uniref:Laminin EGF-like domain-containing protein n=1 Tax=Saguinus oedipus TaxID=9490 RepID=A0ABQ9UC26_SAGOE|nr:hypothetical protein P7K49_028269 [Saguinus oedipus]